MQDLKVTTIQSSLHWENSNKNLQHFDLLLADNTLGDIIVLPEMFNTGFTMNVHEVYQTMKGECVTWMKEKAKQYQALIIGSLIIKENNTYYNRLIACYPKGEIKHYDKRHLFRMANEHDYFSPGKEKLVLSYKGWNICPLVCYDLRFPVWSRNTNNKTDLYLYIANWPEARVSAWSKLLLARAIENLAYVVGVNRIGTDGKNIPYSGGSAVINYKGEIIIEHKPHKESILTTTIKKEALTEFRKKFTAYLDADSFDIKT